MPAATLETAPAAPADAAPMMPLVPFTRASMEHTEQGNLDVTTAALGANSVQLNAVDVPAYGFLRGYLLHVEALGGTGAAAVYQPDAPWSAIQEISLADINGQPIFGPLSGYDLFLVNKWGGYGVFSDPTLFPEYIAPAVTGNYSFMLRIPLELDVRDGLGSIANMNAGANFQVRATLAPSTAVYSTPPTGAPTVRVRGYIEAWAAPTDYDEDGHPQATQPPALGTVQFWSRNPPPVNAGQQNVRLVRVGNYIRGIILVMRNAAGARVASLPDPFTVMWDSRIVYQESLAVRRKLMFERYGQAADTGIIVLDNMHDFDGHAGQEQRDLWWRTAQSTRLEVQGSFGVAGTLGVLTNDVAPDGDIFY